MDNILKVFAGAFALVYFFRKVLFRSLFQQFALLLVVFSISSYAELNEFISFAATILILLIYVLIAVTTHRILILGERSIPEYGYRKISRQEFRYILNCIGLTIVAFGAALLIFIPLIGGLLAAVLIVYLLARFSLVLPAAAINYPMTFAESWELTANHRLLMCATVFLFPVVVSIPELVLGYIPYMAFLATLVSLVTTVVVVAALSVAFKIIHEENDLPLPSI